MLQAAKNQQMQGETSLVRVFLALKASSPVTKNDTCACLNLSRPTVDRAITMLLERGLVERDGHGPSEGGRRAVLYEFNEQAHYAIGGDLELPELNLVLCGLDGMPIASKGFTMPDHCVADPRRSLKFVSESIRELLNEERVALDRVVGIGLGVPAFLKGDTITISGCNLPRWVQVPAKPILEQLLDVPVSVDNDVNFMALSENHAMDYKDRVMGYIALRRGLKGDIRMGGSILLEGKVFHGGGGNAASLQRAYVEVGKLKGLLDRNITSMAAVKELASLVADSLIEPIVHIIRFFDLNRLVINAAVLDNAEEAFVKEITTRLRTELCDEFDWEFEVSMAQDRRFGCAKGGALFVLQEVFKQPAALIEELTAFPS
ncbi:ROK family protein [Candidatus Bipolaricaulota bacterium]|nr:ROK family protein [Candidatus Bipolaricaulota bacterium]